MLLSVFERVVARHLQTAEQIDIYPQERVPLEAPAWRHPGWLEWIINIKYQGGGGITIGAIQRNLGAEMEFHS